MSRYMGGAASLRNGHELRYAKLAPVGSVRSICYIIDFKAYKPEAMSFQDACIYLQDRLVPIELSDAVAEQLAPSTGHFLRTVGLPNSEELGFHFTGKTTTVLSTGIVVLETVGPGRIVCLDLAQHEIIRWQDDANQGFINSSARQFMQCLYEFEHYLQHIQAKELFGTFYNPAGTIAERASYATYLQKKITAIDPAVFDKGYYWPAFIERIEHGL
ncbi:MAG: hypothetical protein EOO63_03730 [Hymenobacter sp.]|nr:MAG: hypothetical protein EOO63_03730 [Hymenobacter sp.]